MWKWITIGLLVTVTALVCGYLIIEEFQDTQQTYNKALAENALDTNIQLVELRSQIAALEEGITNLDGQHSADVDRLSQATRDQQAVIDRQQGQIDSLQRQLNEAYQDRGKLWVKVGDLEARISYLECEVFDLGEDCIAPPIPECPTGQCNCAGGYYDRYGSWVPNCGYYPYGYGYP